MEREIQNFNNQYEIFQENKNILEIKIIETNDLIQRSRLTDIQKVYSTLDVKMRLAFGIKEIRLNNDFVSDKENDLKTCHLLYYKLADLWFAYDSYLKFYENVIGSKKNNVDWIEANVHNDYSSSTQIINAKSSVNEKFRNLYIDEERRNDLIEYLVHCKRNASQSQKRRIDQIIIKITQLNFDFTNSEILTITYAVRNNFVHNGETTIVPDNFGYINKAKLLQILYSYLTVVLLVSSNLTFRNI